MDAIPTIGHWVIRTVRPALLNCHDCLHTSATAPRSQMSYQATTISMIHIQRSTIHSPQSTVHTAILAGFGSLCNESTCVARGLLGTTVTPTGKRHMVAAVSALLDTIGIVFVIRGGHLALMHGAWFRRRSPYLPMQSDKWTAYWLLVWGDVHVQKVWVYFRKVNVKSFTFLSIIMCCDKSMSFEMWINTYLIGLGF